MPNIAFVHEVVSNRCTVHKIDTLKHVHVEFHINNSHINNIFAAYQNFIT